MGLLNGVAISYGKVAPFIATLGSMTIARGLVYVYSGGSPTKAIVNPHFLWITQGRLMGIPAPLIILAFVLVLAYLVLKRTPFGRHVYATGSNPEAAFLAGINVNRTLVLVYSISGMLAGLSGIILASRLSSANATLGSGYELSAIAAVVIGGASLMGGRGNVLGSVVGAYFMALLLNGFVLLNVYPYWQQVATGFLIVVAVILDRIQKRA